jgi:hypothetical protein
MGVSGQRHTLATLNPPGKGSLVPIVQDAGWVPESVWTQRLEEKTLAFASNRTTVIQSVARYYTDCATLAPNDVNTNDSEHLLCWYD